MTSRKRSASLEDSKEALEEPILDAPTLQEALDKFSANSVPLETREFEKHEYGDLKEFPLTQLHKYCYTPLIDEIYDSFQRVYGISKNVGGNIPQSSSDSSSVEQSKFNKPKPIKLRSHLSITGQNSNRDHKGGLFN
jgi:hypothetical protein